MRKQVESLLLKVKKDIADCERFELKVSKKRKYQDAIELMYHAKYYRQIAIELSKILNEETRP